MLQSVVEEKSGGNVEIRSAEQRHKPLGGDRLPFSDQIYQDESHL